MFLFLWYNFYCFFVVQHADEYRNQLDFVQWHIPSKYPTEMAKKSQVVSSFCERWTEVGRGCRRNVVHIN